MSPGRFAERSGSLGVSPSRFAERSLRHPGFAHSCILAFALRASLDCKAGSFGPGSPLAYGFKDSLFAASRRSAAGEGGAGRGGARKRDGSSGAGGTSAKPRPLCGPRTRPVPFSDKEVEARRVGERSRSVWAYPGPATAGASISRPRARRMLRTAVRTSSMSLCCPRRAYIWAW